MPHIERHLSSSASLPSAEAEAVLASFRAHAAGGVVLFVGDSIAEELAQYLHEHLGMKEVLWCTQPGASPADIIAHLRILLKLPRNVDLFNKAALLIVCAGTNLARSMPSLIADEVHKHLIAPLNALLACPKIIIGPIIREHFQSHVDVRGIQGVASCATTRSAPSAGASSSMLHQANLELERRSLDSGYGFVNLFNGRLSVSDFRDNLHLKGEGYLKMLSAVLEVMEGESRAPGVVARAPPCAAASVPTASSSIRSCDAPAVAASAQADVLVAGASEHHLSAGHPSLESSSDQRLQHGSKASSGAAVSKRRGGPQASHLAHEDDRSVRGKYGPTLPVAQIASSVKRKRGGSASASSSSRMGVSDLPDERSTPGVLPPLTIEDLVSQRQQRIQRQRVEGESIHADLSKQMATGVNPSLFLKKLYGVGSGTSALGAGSAARDGDSGNGNCLEGGSCGTTCIGSSHGTSAEVAGAANTALSERGPSDCENGAGPRVRTEPATAVPNDPARSQLLTTVAEVADIVEAQQQQQKQQQEPEQQQQQQQQQRRQQQEQQEQQQQQQRRQQQEQQLQQQQHQQQQGHEDINVRTHLGGGCTNVVGGVVGASGRPSGSGHNQIGKGAGGGPSGCGHNESGEGVSYQGLPCTSHPSPGLRAGKGKATALATSSFMAQPTNQAPHAPAAAAALPPLGRPAPASALVGVKQKQRQASQVVPAIQKTWVLFPLSNNTELAKLNVGIQEHNEGAQDQSDEETDDDFEAGQAFEEVTRSLVETSLKTSHEVFKCTINGMLETATHSLETELERASEQVLSNLPLKIRVLVQQIQADKEEELASRVHMDALQRRADQLAVQDDQHESLRQALSKGLHLQYGDLWSTLPEAEAYVNSRPGPRLRSYTGQSDKCKAFVCGTRPRDDNKGRVERHFSDANCKCIVFLQRVSMKQLRGGSYYPSHWTKHVVQHQGNPVPLLPDLRPDLPPDQLVWACVVTTRHTCMALHPPGVSRMGLAEEEDPSEDGPLGGDGRISCGASNAQSTSTIPSSASAMVAAPRLQRKMKASTHYGILKKSFDARGGKWKAQEVLHEMMQYDPSASLTMAFSVLRLLRAPSLLTPEFNVSMMFGLARNLCDQGFGVIFHVVNAQTVAKMIIDIAASRYKGYQRKNPAAKSEKFNVDNIMPSIEQYIKEGETENKYVLGWTLVPANMMYGNLSNFLPIDAIDGAAMRQTAQGTLFIRGTKDADDHYHPISISVMLASECNLALGAMMDGEDLLLRQIRGSETQRLASSPLDAVGRVTITDGGVSLISQQRGKHPSTYLWRCERHLMADLQKSPLKKSSEVYGELLQIPYGRTHQADTLYAQLPENSPLRRIPREQVCQAYLEASLHGNKTNNFAEVLNHMFEPARTQKELSRSLLAVVSVLKHRHDALQTNVRRCKANALQRQSVGHLLPTDKWPEFATTESVLKEYSDLHEAARDVMQVNVMPNRQYSVQTSAEMTYFVDLNALQPGQYHKACTCGKVGMRKLWCKHVQAVFQRSQSLWQSWVPHHGKAETWETQVGPDFVVPGGESIIASLQTCHETRQFQPLIQPDIRPTPRGRPTSLMQTAEEHRRSKGILEEKDSAKTAQKEFGVLAAGGKSTYNKGGKGTKKSCSLCHERGHTRPTCPRAKLLLNPGHPEDDIDGAVLGAHEADEEFAEDEQNGDEEAAKLEGNDSHVHCYVRATGTGPSANEGTTGCRKKPFAVSSTYTIDTALREDINLRDENSVAASSRNGNLQVQLHVERAISNSGLEISINDASSGQVPTPAPSFEASGYDAGFEQPTARGRAQDAPAPEPKMPAAEEPLPKGWMAAKAPDGRLYYFHVTTKMTTWTRPVAKPSPAAPALSMPAVAPSIPIGSYNGSGGFDAMFGLVPTLECTSAPSFEAGRFEGGGGFDGRGGFENNGGFGMGGVLPGHMGDVLGGYGEAAASPIEQPPDAFSSFGTGDDMYVDMPGQMPGGMGGQFVAPRSASESAPVRTREPATSDAFSSFGGGMGGGMGCVMSDQVTATEVLAEAAVPMICSVTEGSRETALKELALTSARSDAKRCVEMAETLEAEKELEHSKLKGWTREEIRGARFVLEEQGFTICNVKGDGACFYRCLGVAIENDEREHKAYRETVTAHLNYVINAWNETEPEAEIQALYQLMATSLPVEGDLTTLQVIQQFVTYLSLQDEKVDNLGIVLSAKVLEIDIHIHQVDGGIIVLQSSDAVLPNNLEVHVFYDGSHYQYLRRSELGLRPKRPERSFFGSDLRCDRIQHLFDKSLRRWSRAIDMFDKAKISLDSWKRTQDVHVSTRSKSSKAGSVSNAGSQGVARPDALEAVAMVRSDSVARQMAARADGSSINKTLTDAILPDDQSDSQHVINEAQPPSSIAKLSVIQSSMQAPPLPTWDDVLSNRPSVSQPKRGNDVKIYKPRLPGDRLSSIFQKPYAYYLRQMADGTEKLCLQWSGAQELNEGTPLEQLEPLGEKDAFAKRSSLTNFWNLLGRPLEKHHFYFVRKCQDECDGVVLVRSMTRQRHQARGAPRLTLEIAHVCASGPKGSGALLISALCTVLLELEPNTVLRVNLPGQMGTSRGFWSKLGFNEDGGSATTMRMHVKDKAWVPYMKSAFPDQLAVDVQVVPSTDIVPSLLEEIWSEEHMKTWQEKDPEYRMLLEDPNPNAVATFSRTDNIKESVSILSTLDYLGERVNVKGNGSCWLYAVLAGVGLLEHAKKCKITTKSQGEHSPTSRDFKVSAMVIQKMKLYATKTKWDMTVMAREMLLQEVTSLEAATESRNGTWGGGLDTYGVLSNMLGIQIIWLNLTDPKSFILFPGGLKVNQKKVSMKALRMTIDGLVAANLKFVVVEFNGSGHFAGYLPRRPMRLSLDVLNFLGFSES